MTPNGPFLSLYQMEDASNFKKKMNMILIIEIRMAQSCFCLQHRLLQIFLSCNKNTLIEWVLRRKFAFKRCDENKKEDKCKLKS